MTVLTSPEATRPKDEFKPDQIAWYIGLSLGPAAADAVGSIASVAPIEPTDCPEATQPQKEEFTCRQVGWYVELGLGQGAVGSTAVVVPGKGKRSPWKANRTASIETTVGELRQLIGLCSLSPPQPNEGELRYCWQCMYPEKLVMGALCQYCLDHPPQLRDDGWPALGGPPGL